ncbi:MAG: hypothetical protein ONB11_09325 [candidate division KSB1 bacterium]|nr:hypothetical protein [candidate division KSB1 bacterium]
MKKILITLILIFSMSAVQAKTTKPVFLYDIRSQAMGGAGITIPKGSFSYVYNPAILAERKFNLSVLGLKADLSKGFFDVVDYIRDNSENFSKLGKDSTNISVEEKVQIMQELRVEAVKLDNVWFRPVLTPLVGATVQNFGVGLYNVARMGVKLDVGIVDPSVKAYAQDDLVLSLGYGQTIDEHLAIGVGTKIIRRFESETINIAIEQTEGMAATIDTSFNQLKKGITGFGIDLGAIYTFNDKIRFSAVAQDLFCRIGADNVLPNFKLGMAFQQSPRLHLFADVEDLLNIHGEQFVNKFHLGAEYRLPIVSFQAGFNRGYPTIGFGIDIWVLRFNYAFFTNELTGSPGQQPDDYHLLGLEIGW